MSPSVSINQSLFKQNRADFGGAIYHCNQTNLYLNHSQIIDNTSWNRCAFESNNFLYTRMENSLIANNASANANAIGLIATTRNQSCDIINCTILGENNNKYIITAQIGNNDQLDLNIDNSIIAHQNPNFTNNIVAYNFNTFNFNHKEASVIDNGTNTLLSDIDGDLLLNADYSARMLTSCRYGES